LIRNKISTEVKILRKRVKTKIDKEFGQIVTKMHNLPLFSSPKIFILTIITIFLLAFGLTKIDLHTFYDSIRQTTFQYFLLFLLLSVLDIYCLSKRFSVFMKRKNGFMFSVHYLVGYIFGRVIPPRPFGEYIRLLLTEYYYKIKLHDAIFFLVVDDIYDTLILLCFGVVASFILSSSVMFWKVLSVIIVIFSILFIFYIVYTNVISLRGLLGFKIFYNVLNHFKEMLREYLKKFLSLDLQTFLIAGFLTICRYVLSFLRIYLIALMLNAQIGFFAIAGVWTISNIVGTASMLPGGFGAFELTFMYLMQAYGVADTTGLAIAFIDRFFHIWLPAIVGLVYFIYTKTPIMDLHNFFFGKVAEGIRYTFERAKNRRHKTSHKHKTQ